MYRDIADQVQLYGRSLPAESWKARLIDAFRHETKARVSRRVGQVVATSNWYRRSTTRDS